MCRKLLTNLSGPRTALHRCVFLIVVLILLHSLLHSLNLFLYNIMSLHIFFGHKTLKNTLTILSSSQQIVWVSYATCTFFNNIGTYLIIYNSNVRTHLEYCSQVGIPRYIIYVRLFLIRECLSFVKIKIKLL